MTRKTLNFSILGNLSAKAPRGRSLRSLHVLSVIGVLSVLSGCSSMLNVGSPDFACPGLPGGVQCMSARDVYSATNNGNVPLPMLREGEIPSVSQKAAPNARTSQPNEIVAAPDTREGVEVGNAHQPIPNDVVSNYVAPRLPDQPIPIRTPAQVMRIWVAPWEDANGDLNTTGYIYSEIEPRRWVIGDAVEQSAPVLRPLQTIRQGDESRRDEPAAGGLGNNQARRAAEAATARASAAQQ
ncbi:MAG: type IV conjugative transfer system lipoprotein TraV [Acidovorax sp.]|nr:type IV conjugative transfer system lipoprotein TraV [Acidovorax sp.]